jgi:hypothetical protein
LDWEWKPRAARLAFRSRHAPIALSEEEEALLVFAACGITGHALLDLTFGSGLGGSIGARSMGRTIASGDAIQTVGMVLTNDEATYLIKRPQDLTSAEISHLLGLARQKNFVESYRRMRTRIRDGRTAPPWRLSSISTSIGGRCTGGNELPPADQ